jgi:hypothetical protein
MNIKKLILPVALAASMTGIAACGGDDESASSSSGGTSSEATATPTPAAAIEQLTGNTTSVKLDPGFVEALTTLKVTPGPVGDAKISKAGVASFPITGGNVEYYGPDSGVSPYVQGQIDHEGSGLSLTAGGKKVELTDFVVDPGTSTLTGTVSVDGQEAAPAGTPLFFLDGRTLENPPTTDEAAGTVTLTGTTVKLKQEAADLLNDTFGIQDLQGGLVIGVATIEAKLPAS